MLTPFGYYDLKDEMAKSGCPICNLLVRDVQKFLNTILYEYTIEPEMHHIFRKSLGLCNEHGWQMAEAGTGIGTAILYVAVMDEILKKMPNGKSHKKGVRGFLGRADNSNVIDAITTNEPCLVCKKNEDNQKRYVTVFRDHLSDDKFMSAYQESDGMCLDHFKQVLNHTSSPEHSQLLIETQREIWTQLHYELSEFVRKYDFTNADEAMGEEVDSWMRAICQITGAKGVFGRRNAASSLWKKRE